MRKHGLALLALAALSFGLAQGPITVGSKIDTEGSLLAQIVRLVLEQEGIEVEDRSGFGTTSVVRAALLAGEIDLYPEYTGTALTFFPDAELPEGVSADAERLYETVKELDAERNGVVWLGRSPANNTWTIAVPEALAAEHGLTTMADLATYVNAGGAFKLAASQEFVDRDDALAAFERAYGFEVRDDQLVVLAGGNTTQTATAAARGTDGVNAAMAYGTDGILAALGLVALQDPAGAVAIYQPAPIVRGAVASAHPELGAILDPVFAALDEATLAELNGRVAVDGESPAAVAEEFLTARGFLR
ncbi:MAG: ABC transporter substrate-binding protein [Deinococcales bacterium]|nr:ABC transporter substrate-binding protein [Deinococcales bacterium]